MKQDVKRLYEQFKPAHYILDLTPDRDTNTFSGTVIVTGHKVGRPSQRILLHQNGLKITKAHLVHNIKGKDVEKPIDRINNHNAFSEVRIHSSEMLYPGEYTLRLDFTGKITRNMEGIYPCFFTHDGKDKQLIATQFESHHARDAFPCVDEPEAKATFDLILTTPAGEAVVANTPIKNQKTIGKTVRTEFETTPKMSTYLLAFVTGEMGFVEAKTKDGTVIRVYATPDNVEHTRFALKTAVKTLEFYNGYFDIPYPLAKCDFLALPDFASGAMENWGCITFREQALLVDPANTSTDMKQYVANVIAHELTHQWFGNLVTMRWWTDLWLNEGFASWMSFLAVDHLFPQWQVWPQFVAEDHSIALKSDALANTHPIEVPIHHPDEIRTIFDNISYDKGASVINMLFHYLGEDAFRDGLRYYLKKHSYGNTDGVDLWDALESISGKPVHDFMQSWVSLPGYPIVHATVEDSKLALDQKRFYFDPAAERADTVWPVPLLPSMPLEVDMFNSPSIVAELPKGHQQFILNDGRSGFYRTVYNTSHLKHLGEAVKAGRMTPVNRYGLLADAADAAKAGFGSSADVLHLLESYKNEDDPVVWDVISGTLGSVRAVMNDEGLREAMRPYIRKLVTQQFERLGWEEQPGERHFDTLLRPTIIGLAAVAETPEVLAEINRQYTEMKSPEDISPDLRGIIYTTVAYHGDASVYERLLQMHHGSSSSEERVKLTAALTSFKQPELIKRSLSLITTDEVRLQDISYWIAYSFSNRHAREITWDWMKANWSWLQENIGKDLAFFRMPLYAARVQSDLAFLDDYYKFFNDNMGAAFDRNIKQGAETVRWQAAWKQRDFKEIKAFFKA